MKKEESLQRLKSISESILEITGNVTDTSFFQKEKEDKWSIAEHLQHLSLSIIPVNNLLNNPEQMIQRWGPGKKASRSPELFDRDYDAAIQSQPWKSFPGFVPLTAHKPNPSMNLHTAQNKEKLEAFSILVGTKILELPEKMMIKPTEGKDPVISLFAHQTGSLLKHASLLTEKDLDHFQLPLPYLGLVTMGEMIYFVSRHCKQHLIRIKELTAIYGTY